MPWNRKLGWIRKTNLILDIWWFIVYNLLIKEILMYCQKCGTQSEDGGLFCKSCGNRLDGQTSNSEKPTPTALIIISWLVVLSRFIPMNNTLRIILDIAAIVLAIILLVSKNKVGRINGVIILVLWVIGFFVGFIPAFINARYGL
jgi:uncharacterized protein (DUF983 family)